MKNEKYLGKEVLLVDGINQRIGTIVKVSKKYSKVIGITEETEIEVEDGSTEYVNYEISTTREMNGIGIYVIVDGGKDHE